VFTPSRRDDVRRQLFELASRDPRIPAAAHTGSYAVDASDEFSDIDLAFAITGDLAAALTGWTELLNRDFVAVHHWDLPVGATVYRVFLLSDGLELDIARPPHTPAAALELAWEYAEYCADGVDGLYEADTLAQLAASLIDADVVHLWWD